MKKKEIQEILNQPPTTMKDLREAFPPGQFLNGSQWRLEVELKKPDGKCTYCKKTAYKDTLLCKVHLEIMLNNKKQQDAIVQSQVKQIKLWHEEEEDANQE